MMYIDSVKFCFGLVSYFTIKFLPERIGGFEGLSFCHLLPEQKWDIIKIHIVEFIPDRFGSLLEKCLEECAHAMVDMCLRGTGGQEVTQFVISWGVAWNWTRILSALGWGKVKTQTCRCGLPQIHWYGKDLFR